ncbi:hypothetical protein [Paraburkholderia dilworthii]|uniref:hypothetical protein n=1 Tax=Paraburkholderia dilworthii TaxID=948106 RepID=UPI00040E67BE|nr:hypothetical protein [Paraburkholderia dilworthii]
MRVKYSSAKAFTCCVAVLSLTLSPLRMARASSDDTRGAAALFVEQQHIGSNLPSLAWMVAIRTVTFAALVHRLGRTEAASLVRAKLSLYRSDYQASWDANLASAYANELTADELRSLAKYGPTSPFASKLRSVQNDVGGEMQVASKALLTSYVSIALNAALREAPSPDSSGHVGDPR